MQEQNRGQVSERILRRFKTQEERDEFERSYKRAKRVLTAVNEYFVDETKRSTESMDSPKNFETANWELHQAWQAGYRYAMRVASDITRI